MKHLIIISKGKNTAQAFTDQLQPLIGKHVQLTNFSLEDDLEDNIQGDLILISSQQVYQRVKSYICTTCPVIIARRSINYHELEKLLAIPAQTDILLVNDMPSSTYQTILYLQMLGLNHINYYPYSPENLDFPKLPIAVTPGECELVPNSVEKIIDIKVRPIDISTLVEILIQLDLLSIYADFLSANYVQEIIQLTQRRMNAMNISNKNEMQLQTILNTVQDGIIAINENNCISAINPVAVNLFGLEVQQILDCPVENIVNEQLRSIFTDKSNLMKDKDAKDCLVELKQRQFIISIAYMTANNLNCGRLYILRDVSEIRRLEETIRCKMINEQKIARYNFSDVIGKSDSIKAILDRAKKMANSDSTILIQGESGTGKEIIAQSIHNASPRSNGPFVAVNFAALTENLLESELFGYIAGAFTGANRGGSPGLFEEAHNGTIFLDEIGDAPLSFQVKLLRVLQERQIRRIGSAKIIPIDVRVIVATNHDLKRLIEEGLFRQDLYYRLNVLPIKMPALRDRAEDIILLAHNFYHNEQKIKIQLPPAIYFCKIEPYLLQYNWPGNIRELHNVVEYLVNICSQDIPAVELLPDEIRNYYPNEVGFDFEHKKLKNYIYNEILYANQYHISIGRRSLAEHLQLPENQVRLLLKELVAEGLIIQQQGRNGLKICARENK